MNVAQISREAKTTTNSVVLTTVQLVITLSLILTVHAQDVYLVHMLIHNKDIVILEIIIKIMEEEIVMTANIIHNIVLMVSVLSVKMVLEHQMIIYDASKMIVSMVNSTTQVTVDALTVNLIPEPTTMEKNVKLMSVNQIKSYLLTEDVRLVVLTLIITAMAKHAQRHHASAKELLVKVNAKTAQLEPRFQMTREDVSLSHAHQTRSGHMTQELDKTIVKTVHLAHIQIQLEINVSQSLAHQASFHHLTAEPVFSPDAFLTKLL